MQPATSQEPSFGLDTSIFMHVIENGDAEQRTQLSHQLAGFLAKEDVAAAEREQVVPVVLKLAVDTVVQVRKALADGLVNVEKLHADILFSIISDDDEIALPFLSATPALNHWHMLAVLRVGDEARQACVALRPDISDEAIDYIVNSLPLNIALLLCENESVAFTTESATSDALTFEVIQLSVTYSPVLSCFALPAQPSTDTKTTARATAIKRLSCFMFNISRVKVIVIRATFNDGATVRCRAPRRRCQYSRTEK